MAFPPVIFYARIGLLTGRFLFSLLWQQLTSFVHRWTYRAVPRPKHIVIVGSSFAGVHLARRLANSLPTGYSVILIEKNSHFHYTFAFPRFSVVGGQEPKAFIPFTSIAKGVPPGSLSIIQDSAVRIDDGKVLLSSGQVVEYDFLAIATGASQPAPARLEATNKENACGELRGYQTAVANAYTIAVIGGGAVGVQLAADIKSYFPKKEVTLIHSRDRLLGRFGVRLHNIAFEQLRKLGVDVVLNERPKIPKTSSSFVASQVSIPLGSGHLETFDLVVRC